MSPASDLSTQRIEDARLAALQYLNADPNLFDLVFVANATAAIKLVADCFRDQGFEYVYHKDAHNSVVGVREVTNHPSRCLTTNEEVEGWIEQQKFSSSSNLRLFAYPAQSNMTGYRPPYSWCKSVHDACYRVDSPQRTFVLLDAASYLTSARLDLSNFDDAPDFVALSFYKMFGYPDLGALIVKRTAFNVMTNRRYFGGGTVDIVTVVDHALHRSKVHNIHDFLEDGTLPFHNIVALKYAIATHKKLFGTAKDVSLHTGQLSAWLYHQLRDLRHANGEPVVRIYQDFNAIYGDSHTQGPIICFNVLKSDGCFVGKSHLERLAIDCGFQIRTGGVCNPGGIASMLNLRHWELRRNYVAGSRCGDGVDVVGGKPTGICRVSLGPMSTMSDIKRFVDFIEQHFVDINITSPSTAHSSESRTPSINCVIPITGCSGFTVSDDTYDAYSVWHHNWCIVDTTSDSIVSSSEVLRTLTVNVRPQSEELVITHDSGNEFTMDLWEIPKTCVVDEHQSQRLFDIYETVSVGMWFQMTLGFSCALARYRGEDLKQTEEARTCTVSGCEAVFADNDTLHNHYSFHAKRFLATHPFQALRRTSPLRTWRKTFRNWSTSPSASWPFEQAHRGSSIAFRSFANLGSSLRLSHGSNATLVDTIETAPRPYQNSSHVPSQIAIDTTDSRRGVTRTMFMSKRNRLRSITQVLDKT